MAFSAKVLGNALANRSRGMESDLSKKINPGNMPINDTPDIPVETPDTFDVPVDALQGVVEGDVLTVTAVGDTVTLTKQAGTEPIAEPIAPPIL